MKIAGIDLGFRQVKLSTERGNRKFSSIIGYPSSVELKTQEEPLTESNIYIEDNKQVFYVGEKALRDTKNSQLTFIAEKTDRSSDRIKYLSALGLALNGDKKGDFYVVTGLPVDEFAGIKGLKEKLKENLEGTFDYKLGPDKIHATVNNVLVIPQSAGAYYDHIMDDEGLILKENVNPKTLVIDIGFRTTDIVTLVNAKYSPSESFTEVTGISNVHKEMRKLLIREFRLTKDLTEIDDIVRNKEVILGGKTYNIEELIHEAVRPFAEKIISAIPLYLNDIREVHQILITGGGANLMYEFFEKEFKDTTSVTHMEDSEFSNARGYFKYARFLIKNGKE